MMRAHKLHMGPYLEAPLAVPSLMELSLEWHYRQVPELQGSLGAPTRQAMGWTPPGPDGAGFCGQADQEEWVDGRVHASSTKRVALLGC